jgi:hypothetical protein
MNRSVRTVSISSTLPPVERTYLDDRGNPRRDDRRSRDALDVSTFVTTCSTQAQFTGKDGKLHAGGMTTIRLYGVQGVATQPVQMPPHRVRPDKSF